MDTQGIDNQYMLAISQNGTRVYTLTVATVTQSQRNEKYFDVTFVQLKPNIRVSCQAAMAKNLKPGDTEEAEIEVQDAKDPRYKNYYLKRFGQTQKGKGYVPKSKEEVYADPIGHIIAAAITASAGDIEKAKHLTAWGIKELYDQATNVGKPIAVKPAMRREEPETQVVDRDPFGHDEKKKPTPVEIQARRTKWLESIGFTALEISDLNGWCSSQNMTFADACKRARNAGATNRDALYQILLKGEAA